MKSKPSLLDYKNFDGYQSPDKRQTSRMRSSLGSKSSMMKTNRGKQRKSRRMKRTMSKKMKQQRSRTSNRMSMKKGGAGRGVKQTKINKHAMDTFSRIISKLSREKLKSNIKITDDSDKSDYESENSSTDSPIETPSSLYQSPLMKKESVIMSKTSMKKKGKRSSRGRRQSRKMQQSSATSSLKSEDASQMKMMTKMKSKRKGGRRSYRRSSLSLSKTNTKRSSSGIRRAKSISKNQRIKSKSKTSMRSKRTRGLKYFMSPKMIKMMKELDDQTDDGQSSAMNLSKTSLRKGKGGRDTAHTINESNSLLLYKLPPEERDQILELADEMINDSFIVNDTDDNYDDGIDKLLSRLNSGLAKQMGSDSHIKMSKSKRQKQQQESREKLNKSQHN